MNKKKRKEALRLAKKVQSAVALWQMPEGERQSKKKRRKQRMLGLVEETAPPPGSGRNGTILATLPRRRTLLGAEPVRGDARPPMAKRVSFRPSIRQTAVRLSLWIYGLAHFLAGCAWDVLRRRASRRARAVRLRETFESLGAAFIKVGQQLSIRADMIPHEYCEELAKMLDRVPPFPVEVAIQTIERTTGRKLDAMFSQFDPVPIGSASVACVFQAYLREGGERVAVKVRRPGIGELFAADMRALHWILGTAERLTVLREGMTESLLRELNTMLMGELDFRQEGRLTDIFRRRARKKRVHVTAPRVHFDYSNEQVLVTEFVSGIWMWELMAAVDRDDQKALAEVRARGIDPTVVAKYLTRAVHWEALEHIFFHADPHPANMVVQPGNTICFIDFGACGRFSSKTRHQWKQLHYNMLHADANKMVQSALGLLEPLPPIDVDKFSREIENLYWDWLYAQHSTDAEWWERSTGNVWVQFVGIARKYGIAVNIESLQFFRATLLYDSVILRLCKDIDMNKEYRRYLDEAGGRARKRVLAAARDRVGGPTTGDYLVLEEIQLLGNQFLHRVQRALDTPLFSFTNMISKAAFGIAHTIAMLGVAVGITLLLLMGWIVVAAATGRPIHVWHFLGDIVMHQAYQVGLVIGALIVVRRVLARMRDVDAK